MSVPMDRDHANELLQTHPVFIASSTGLGAFHLDSGDGHGAFDRHPEDVEDAGRSKDIYNSAPRLQAKLDRIDRAHKAMKEMEMERKQITKCFYVVFLSGCILMVGLIILLAVDRAHGL